MPRSFVACVIAVSAAILFAATSPAAAPQPAPNPFNDAATTSPALTSSRLPSSSPRVDFQGQRRTLEEVAQLVGSDARWKEYETRRRAIGDSPEEHADLAKWCLKNGLENEERVQWTYVLKASPENKLARNRIGLEKLHGDLLTHEQAERERGNQARAKANLARFTPQFQAICRRAASKEPSERQAALDELRRVADPDALAALESVVSRAARHAHKQLSLELNLALIAALGNVSDAAATNRLVSYALDAPQPEVRTQAAILLGKRPVTDYAPQLLGALQAPIEGQVDAQLSAEGVVSYAENLTQVGPEADQAVSRTRAYIVTAQPNLRGETRSTTPRLFASYASAESTAQQRRQSIDQTNQQAELRNQRIREVLHTALGVELGADPNVYWQAWKDYNDLAYDEHPTLRFEDVDYRREVIAPPEDVGVTHSCFAPGTPVWTQAGARPIETIIPGDLVLAQNPSTGELAFRPVVEKTLGPPRQTLILTLPREIITVTPGHRFWTPNRGWQMAKFLEPAAPLGALESTPAVQQIRSGPTIPCHNLVVADDHTFFVGAERILVHDKTCPEPLPLARWPARAVRMRSR